MIRLVACQLLAEIWPLFITRKTNYASQQAPKIITSNGGREWSETHTRVKNTPFFQSTWNYDSSLNAFFFTSTKIRLVCERAAGRTSSPFRGVFSFNQLMRRSVGRGDAWQIRMLLQWYWHTHTHTLWRLTSSTLHTTKHIWKEGVRLLLPPSSQPRMQSSAVYSLYTRQALALFLLL